MSKNGERDMADATYGSGWSTRIENRLKEGDERFGRLEKRTESIVDNQIKLGTEIRQHREVTGQRHREIMGVLEGVRAKQDAHVSYADDDGEVITGVHDSRQLEKAARALRDRNQELISHRTRQRIAVIVATITAIGSTLAMIIQATR